MKKIIVGGIVLFSTVFAQARDLKKEDSQKVQKSESAAKESKSGGVKADFLVGGDLGVSIPLGAGGRDVASPGLQIGIAAEYYLFSKLGATNGAKNISVTTNLNENIFGRKTYYYYHNDNAYFDYKLNITTFSIGANYHFLNPADKGLGLYVGLALTANQYNIRYDAYDYNGNGKGYGYGNRHYRGTSMGVLPRFGLQYGFNANWVLNTEIGTNLILGSPDYYDKHGDYYYYGGPSGSLSYLQLTIGIRYRFKL